MAEKGEQLLLRKQTPEEVEEIGVRTIMRNLEALRPHGRRLASEETRTRGEAGNDKTNNDSFRS